MSISLWEIVARFQDLADHKAARLSLGSSDEVRDVDADMMVVALTALAELSDRVNDIEHVRDPHPFTGKAER